MGNRANPEFEIVSTHRKNHTANWLSTIEKEDRRVVRIQETAKEVINAKKFLKFI